MGRETGLLVGPTRDPVDVGGRDEAGLLPSSSDRPTPEKPRPMTAKSGAACGSFCDQPQAGDHRERPQLTMVVDATTSPARWRWHVPSDGQLTADKECP
jgi:hypothetical protein